MNTFTKKLILEVTFTTLLVAVLVGGILFFRKNINFYRDNIVTERKKLEDLTYKSASLYELQNQYKEAEIYLNKLNNILPNYYDLINFNKDLQSLAASRGLSFSFSFVGEGVKKESGMGYINFNIVVGSKNLEDLINFLKDLEKFRYFNIVDDVSFMTQGEESFSLNIKGRVFYRS
jgi:Tfp pilus assembly protein PilO